MKYRVKEWDTYQHYKDRNPPWIKLHFALLTSRTWVTLDDASRVLAVAIMLLASRTDGEIDASEAGLAYLQRLAYLNSPPDLKPLIDNGFLVPLADASSLHASARPETETETEAETEERERQSADRASAFDNENLELPRQGLVGVPPEAALVVSTADATRDQLDYIGLMAEKTGIPPAEMLARINATTFTKRTASHVIDLYENEWKKMKNSANRAMTFAEQKRANTVNAGIELLEEMSRGSN